MKIVVEIDGVSVVKDVHQHFANIMIQNGKAKPHVSKKAEPIEEIKNKAVKPSKAK